MSATTQTVVIVWTEVSHHRATVNVASGVDLDCVDMGDALAALSGVGFMGAGGVVARVEHDAAALRFDRSGLMRGVPARRTRAGTPFSVSPMVRASLGSATASTLGVAAFWALELCRRHVPVGPAGGYAVWVLLSLAAAMVSVMALASPSQKSQ